MNDEKRLLRKISIKTRLTIFYSIAAFVVLTILSLMLYWQTINVLYKTDYRFLSDEVDTIKYILNNEPFDIRELKQAVIDAPTQTDRSIYRYYIRVLDSKEMTIMETPEMGDILPSNQFAYKPHHKASYHWYNKNDKRYLLIRSSVHLQNNSTGLIEIVLDISYQHAFISDRKILVAAILLSAICSIFLGFLITRRGMNSLDELTETVRTITAKSLNQRIDPKSLPIELAKLGIAFNQMLDRIENSFTRLKQFSSDLAHELRIPVNNLIGQTEIVLTTNQSLPEYKQILESNLEEFNRISHLIENILFLAKAENPHLNLEKSPLDLAGTISMMRDYYQPLSDEKNITVSQEGSATLTMNAIMIRRMFSNLLSNALKYTPTGGKIHLSLDKTDTDETKIVISDTGIGIPEHHLPKLFDRFYRVDSARNQETGGSGLGLSIVKSIVHMHSGRIELASEVGIGTTFTIYFPN